MPFKELSALTRRQPLGRVRYNDLLGNQIANRDLLLREHRSDGTHNLLRAPRAVALVRYSAGYTLVGASPGITNVSGASGTSTLTLSASYFDDADSISVVAMPASGGATYPRILNWSVASATSVSVYSFANDAGGTGLWGVLDASYYVAIYANPIAHSPTLITTAPLTPGSAHLTADRYNALIDNSIANANILAEEHTPGGAHANREFPSSISYVPFDSGGTTYSRTAHVIGHGGGGGGLATRVSAGIVDITLPSIAFATDPLNFNAQVFTRVKAAAGEHWTATVDESSITNDGSDFTGFRVHLWKRTGLNTWALTDGSFWNVFHCDHAVP